MDVSIVSAIYKPDKEVFDMLIKGFKSQKFKGKVEIVLVDKGWGFAESLNYGVRKAKNPIVVSVHQDCIASSDDWLQKLVEPLKDKNVVATVSKVELPFDFWNKLDPIAKILSVKEQDIITSLLDEKGCAYRKKDLLKVKLFDNKNFRTAGEDFDMYFKLRKLGKIEYPDAKVIHYHKYTWKNRFKKELQLSNAFGALFRIYDSSMTRWYLGLIKSIPFLGYPLFLITMRPKKLGFFLSLLALPIYLYVNFIYSYGFWKGFIMGKETV